MTYLHAVLLDWKNAEEHVPGIVPRALGKIRRVRAGHEFPRLGHPDRENKAMHFQRSRKRLAKFLNCELQVSLAAVAAGRDAAATNASLAALTICMDRLGQADQDLVRRCYGDRLTVRQVASQLGRSPESVHHSLRRVRTLLLSVSEKCGRTIHERLSERPR